MPHDNEVNIEKGTGVGTDGSLRSAKEGFFDHGADRSGDESDGVGTDGSLVNPEKEAAEAGTYRNATDPAVERASDRPYTDRDAATDPAFTERDTGMDPR